MDAVASAAGEVAVVGLLARASKQAGHLVLLCSSGSRAMARCRRRIRLQLVHLWWVELRRTGQS